MTESQYILLSLITGLGAVAFLMIKNWARTWESRLTACDYRLEQHDLQIATITANMEHIFVIGDETHDNVEELLRQSGGVKAKNGAGSSG